MIAIRLGHKRIAVVLADFGVATVGPGRPTVQRC